MTTFASFQQDNIKPADNTPQPGLMSKIGGAISGAVGGVANKIGGIASDVGTGIYNFGKDYVNSVGQTWAETPQNMANDVASGAADMQKGLQNNTLTSIPSAGDVGNVLKGTAKASFGTASDAIKAIFAPITSIVTASTKNISDLASEAPAVQSVATSPLGDNIQKAQDAVSQIQKQYPGSTKMLGDIFNVVAGLVGERVAPGDTTQTGTDLTKISDTAGNIWEKGYGTSASGPSPRIADATPSVEQVHATEGGYTGNVKNPEGEIVHRVNVGGGPLGNKTVVTSAAEAEQGKTLDSLKNYPDKGTPLQKSQAVSKGISVEAENMRSGLRAEDKSNPLDTNAEKLKVSQLVRENLPEDIQTKVGVNTPEENAMLKGMSENAGSPVPKGGNYDLRAPGEEPTFPKTAAGNYYKTVLQELNKFDGTREGKLNLRQAIDSAYENARGKLAWGSDSQNALDEVNRDIRNSLTKDLAESSTNTDVQSSLRTQTNLYRAKDTLDWKANQEGSNNLKTWMKQNPEKARILRHVLISATGIGTAGYVFRKEIADMFK